MLKKIVIKLLFGFIGMIFLASCAQATPEAAVVVEPTETPVPPTDTPVPPTETPEPTDTPVPPTDTPEPTATIAKELEFGLTMIREKDGMEMVSVPSGWMMRGSSDEQIDWVMDQEWCADCKKYQFGLEQPQREVYLDAFWIDKFEVTNAQYAVCVAEGACDEPLLFSSPTRDNYYGNPEYADYPVISVMQLQAKKYCEWAGGSLPSEAQWEKAAHGTDGRPFPWGEAAPTCDLANFAAGGEPCVGDTAPFGNYPEGASPYGAMDMAGNVLEWVLDGPCDYNLFKVIENPVCLVQIGEKVLRGGFWESIESRLRTQFRAYDDYDKNHPRLESYGFRCMMAP
jgi:serine/threonine-protein kinase